MIILSQNVRGVGGSPKLLTLKRLVGLNHPDIMYFQETMVYGERAYGVFKNVVKYWEFFVMDSSRQSGGLLCAWNPKVVKCCPFLLV